VVNSAKNTVREAEVMGTTPNAAIAEMAEHLVDGARHLADACSTLAERDHSRSTASADAAVKSQRRFEHAYRTSMSALIDAGDLREVAAQRELYRRLARTSDQIVDVAERIWYAVLKQT